MSVVSENVGGPDAPELAEDLGDCINCELPLARGHYVRGPMGGYCLACNRHVIATLGCSVTELARRKAARDGI